MLVVATTTKRGLLSVFVAYLVVNVTMTTTSVVNGLDFTDSTKCVQRIESMLADSVHELRSQGGDGSTSSSGKDNCPELPEPLGLGPVAKLIYDSMQTPGRVYHAMQHVFEVSREMTDPIMLLSALFHDVIYYSIDQTFSKEQSQELQGVILPDMETQQLTLASKFDDPLVEMVASLYGFLPGHPLPKLGTNEFLSAMIGIKVLSKYLRYSHLLQIATCIEATIPFRNTEDGKTPMDRLYDRLVPLSKGQSEEWLVDTVQKAAITANYDLGSFDSTDRDYFMDSSWKLLPEARPILLREDCPLVEFLHELQALQGRTKFLQGVVPRIFQCYRNVPTPEEMDEKRRMTHENLRVVSEYAQIRLLQVLVLVEFVDVMGEDPLSVPLRSCLRMGLPPAPEGEPENLTPVQKEIRHWLIHGRRADFAWDPAASPLAAYLYDTLGPDGVRQAIAIANGQEPGSHELLKFLPKSVVLTVASRLGSVLPDRAERLLQVPEKLGILAQ
jgi:hypothetical protein